MPSTLPVDFVIADFRALGPAPLLSVQQKAVILSVRSHALLNSLPPYDSDCLEPYDFEHDIMMLADWLSLTLVRVPPYEMREFWNRAWDVIALWENTPFFANKVEARMAVQARICAGATLVQQRRLPLPARRATFPWREDLDMERQRAFRRRVQSRSIDPTWLLFRLYDNRMKAVLDHLTECKTHVDDDGVYSSPCLCSVRDEAHDDTKCCCIP